MYRQTRNTVATFNPHIYIYIYFCNILPLDVVWICQSIPPQELEDDCVTYLRGLTIYVRIIRKKFFQFFS